MQSEERKKEKTRIQNNDSINRSRLLKSGSASACALRQRRRRRVDRLEHVAADQQRVDRLRLDRVREPAQELAVLVLPRLRMQGVAQVPAQGWEPLSGGIDPMPTVEHEGEKAEL